MSKRVKRMDRNAKSMYKKTKKIHNKQDLTNGYCGYNRKNKRWEKILRQKNYM